MAQPFTSSVLRRTRSALTHRVLLAPAYRTGSALRFAVPAGTVRNGKQEGRGRAGIPGVNSGAITYRAYRH